MGYACFTGHRVQMQRGGSRNRIPHSLWPGTPGGVSASVTGSHRRLLRQGERCSNLRRVSSVMPPKRIGGRGRRGQETPPPGRLWRSSQMEGTRVTDTGAGQKGREVRDARETPPTTPGLGSGVP